MSNDNNGNSWLEGASESRGLALPPASRTDLQEPWNGGPPEEAAAAPGTGMAAYLHAFRRRWIVALCVGVSLSLTAGVAFWFLYIPKCTATAYLKVSATEARIFSTGSSPEMTPNFFDVYKNTQKEWLKSRFVINAALRKPSIANLAMLQDAQDKAEWVAKEIRVDFPSGSELMLVSMTGTNAEETAALVNAVVDAYHNEIVERSDRERQSKLRELNAFRDETQKKITDTRQKLQRFAEANQGQAGEREAMQLQQQIALQHYSTLRSEYTKVHFLLMEGRSRLAMLEEAQKAPEQELSDNDMEYVMRNDQIAATLQSRSVGLRELIGQIEAAATEVASRNSVKRHQASLDKIQSQLGQRREELRKEMKTRRPAMAGADIARLKTELAIMGKQEEELLRDATRAEEQAREIGKTSINVEMMRTDLKGFDDFISRLDAQIRGAEVEAKTEPRVTKAGPALKPENVDQARRYSLLAMCLMSGFALPVCSIIWWDTRAKRLNHQDEVSRSTGLSVIGNVPLLPASAMRSDLVPTARHQQLRAMMSESIDSIAARLIHKARSEQTRVILVASAVVGEGKTTLATHLAMSLARTGHRTLLIDFDLRQPSIDQIFGLQATPGISEAIRGEVPVEKAAQETSMENLSVIAAGRGDRQALALLATGAVDPILEKLREQYEFIVIDSSPVLPVADVRFICRAVDGVVLAVLRDVSRIPAVQSACEVFAGFGIRPLGAVMTGAVAEADYQASAYQAEAWQ